MSIWNRRAVGRLTGCGAVLSLLVGAALAALPPAAEREVELDAILHSSDVRLALQTQQPIHSIEYAGDDLYRVRAGKCRALVQVVDDPRGPQRPGPRHFLLRVVQQGCD